MPNDQHDFEQHPDIRLLKGLDSQSNLETATQAGLELFLENSTRGRELFVDQLPLDCGFVITTFSGKQHNFYKNENGEYFRPAKLETNVMQQIQFIGASPNGSPMAKTGRPSIVFDHYLLFQDRYCFRNGDAPHLPLLFKSLKTPEQQPKGNLDDYLKTGIVSVLSDGNMYWTINNFAETHALGPILSVTGTGK